jgi:phosphatidylinositol-bisphosphatase
MVVTSCQWFHVQVGSKNLMGILLCVFAKKRLMPFIADFHDAATGVGLMGMVGAVCNAVHCHTAAVRVRLRLRCTQGNKGAVCIRFRVHDSSVCLVCSHLAAHENNVERRNADFANIIAKTEFRHVEG